MKFVTREKPKVDRVACPWLIRRFLDPNAELLFVPADQIMQVAETEGALPYDVSGVELGHHNGSSSFESFIATYTLTDTALLVLARIVRAADTQDRDAAPEGEGLRQIANGWHLLDWPLEKRLDVGFGVYDCLYAVCQQRISRRTVLFLCPHNAAKSIIAAEYFNQKAHADGLAWRADSAGTEPAETVSPVVVAMLRQDGLDVSQVKPRLVTPAELRDSGLVVSIGCTSQELNGIMRDVEYWDDVPLVSQNPEGSREAIRRQIDELIYSLGTNRS